MGDEASIALIPALTDEDWESILAIPSREPPFRVGRYEAIERLGRGSFGSVYRARAVHLSDESAQAYVAIKLLSDLSRPAAEAAKAFRVRHPAVASMLDRGEMADGTAYVVYELVDGVPFDAWAEGRGEREVVGALRTVAGGVQAAHARGVVHNDLGAHNILVGRAGPVVVDFGAAEEGASTARDIRAIQRLIPGRKRTLRRIRAHRYASAEALAGDLGGWLERRPIHWMRPPLWRRAGMWAVREPREVAGVVLAVALLSAATGYGLRVRAQHRAAAAHAREMEDMNRRAGAMVQGALDTLRWVRDARDAWREAGERVEGGEAGGEAASDRAGPDEAGPAAGATGSSD